MNRSKDLGPWSACLDALLVFDRFEKFTPPFTQSDEFIFYMNGLIRPTIQYAHAARILIHDGNLQSAEVITRSAFEHSLWAQFFYLHKAEPELISKKALLEQQSFLTRCKADAEFFNFALAQSQLDENEFDNTLAKLSMQLESLSTKQVLPRNSEITKSLTTESGKDFAQLVRIYLQMSQLVHPSAGFFAYGTFEHTTFELFKNSKSVNPESALKVISRCCAWVLAIQEDLLADDSHSEELITITSQFGFQPWLRLVTKNNSF